MLKYIILDLDETLIHSIEKEKVNTMVTTFKTHVFDKYVIFERPCLEMFLKELTKEFKICVWTAASFTYAQFIVKYIIEPYIGKQVYFLYHDIHCDISFKKFGILKHLDLVQMFNKTFTKTNTLLVDDNTDVLRQNNCVLNIQKFNLNPKDQELSKILKKIIMIKSYLKY